jgi:hypothetical protein
MVLEQTPYSLNRSTFLNPNTPNTRKNRFARPKSTAKTTDIGLRPQLDHHRLTQIQTVPKKSREKIVYPLIGTCQ